jgi:hypothetical protein
MRLLENIGQDKKIMERIEKGKEIRGTKKPD